MPTKHASTSKNESTLSSWPDAPSSEAGSLQSAPPGGVLPLEETSWPEIHAHRLGWALRARDELVSRIQDEEIRWLYEAASSESAGSSARVAVIGPTQVGKTTVILRLLRLTEEGEAIVGRVLRGGRKQGQSASASAAVYKASPDDAFRYQESVNHEEEALSEVEIKERLGDLRRRVEAGTFSTTDAVHIGFPARYFSDAALEGLRIIDLPGLDSKSQEERYLTEDLLDRYLPHATLALLVERADNLTSLGYLTVPGVGEGWLSFPQRYAVILTRAVAAASVQEELRKGRYPTLAKLRDAYRYELARALVPLSEGRQSEEELRHSVGALSLYPLDLGQSRSQLPADVLERATPLLDESEEALLEHVGRAGKPAGALVVTAGLYRAASAIREGIDREYERQREDVTKRIRRAAESLDLLKAKGERLKAEITNEEKARRARNAGLNALPRKVKVRLETRPKGRVRVAAIKKHITKHATRARKGVREVVNGANALGLSLPKDLPRKAAKEFDSAVAGMRERLNGHWVDWYTSEGKAQRDLGWARTEVGRGLKRVRKACETALKEAIDEASVATDAKVTKLRAQLRTLHVEEQSERDVQAKEETERDKLDAHHTERVRQIERDIEVGRTFQELLEEHYLAEHTALRQRLQAPVLSDADRFHTLAYLHLIADVRRRLSGRLEVAGP